MVGVRRIFALCCAVSSLTQAIRVGDGEEHASLLDATTGAMVKEFMASTQKLASQSQQQGQLGLFNDQPLEVKQGEAAHFLNAVVKLLWPRIGAMLSKKMLSEIGPMINQKCKDKTSGYLTFRFEKFYLGDKAPEFTDMKIYRAANNENLKIKLKMTLDADPEIQCTMSALKVGVNDLKIIGDMVIRLDQLLDEPPFIGGLAIHFIDEPYIDYKMTGLGKLSMIPGVQGKIQGIVKEIVNGLFTMPHQFIVPLGQRHQGVNLAELRHPMPLGFLRLTPKEIKLSKGDGCGTDQKMLWGMMQGSKKKFTEAMYKVGTKKWASETSDENGTWAAGKDGPLFKDLIVYDRDERLSVRVCKAHSEPKTVAEFTKTEGESDEVELAVKSGDEKIEGTFKTGLKFMPLQKELGPCKSSVCLVRLAIDDVSIELKGGQDEEQKLIGKATLNVAVKTTEDSFEEESGPIQKKAVEIDPCTGLPKVSRGQEEAIQTDNQDPPGAEEDMSKYSKPGVEAGPPQQVNPGGEVIMGSQDGPNGGPPEDPPPKEPKEAAFVQLGVEEQGETYPDPFAPDEGQRDPVADARALLMQLASAEEGALLQGTADSLERQNADLRGQNNKLKESLRALLMQRGEQAAPPGGPSGGPAGGPAGPPAGGPAGDSHGDEPHAPDEDEMHSMGGQGTLGEPEADSGSQGTPRRTMTQLQELEYDLDEVIWVEIPKEVMDAGGSVVINLMMDQKPVISTPITLDLGDLGFIAKQQKVDSPEAKEGSWSVLFEGSIMGLEE